MSANGTTYTNPNAAGVQKKCPECYKINQGDVAVCSGCGADLSRVNTEGAGLRNAGLFGFMPAGMPKMGKLEPSAPKRVIADRAVRKDLPTNPSLSFPRCIAPVKPWS